MDCYAQAVSDVVKVIGRNVELIRRTRQLTGKDLSERLKELGLSMSVATVSEVERGKRKVSAAELLVFAIALNVSVIDLLTPGDGSALQITEGIDPIPLERLEPWLTGEHPWPLNPGDKAYNDAYFDAVNSDRGWQRRIAGRPEVAVIDQLRAYVSEAFRAMDDPAGRFSWKNLAGALKIALKDVDDEITMLIAHLEKKPDGG